MGALIQTKGTQRLANLFNSRFNATNIPTTRRVAGTRTLSDAFSDASLDLLAISDLFIAQNAVSATWIGDLTDVLYPSTTLRVATIASPTQLTFTVPAGFTAVPPSMAVGSSVCSLDKRKSIPKGTNIVTPAPAISAGILTVNFSGPVNTCAVNERISFAAGNHERLVRRWRWYLQHDLAPENHQAIRQAISTALNDNDFKSISFQTIEETQKVLISRRQALKALDELDDTTEMHIILMTQATTSPDRLDNQ